MTDLSADELTILLIAAKGQPMMPIGRWKEPARSLVARGFLKATPSPQDPDGMFNLRLTEAGAAEATKQDTVYDRQLGKLLDTSTAIAHEQQKARAHAEQIAVQLVDLSEATARVTGEDRVAALERWSRIILTRALEMMR